VSEELVERFIKYIKFDTRSDENSETIPSTQSQVEFAELLINDLGEIGLEEIEYNDGNGYVTASLPANTNQDIPVVGFISHMDTADFNSENIQPQIHENYSGHTIILNEEKNVVLSPKEFPHLKNYIGETLVTTDGTTLLGSDDKSGIAEIMEAVKYLIDNPEIKHGKVRLGFGPDEEIGIGADRFDVEQFGADFAYTVDGGPVGELQFESFNAAGAEVTFSGKNVHPGTAKDKMVNAITLAVDFDSQLPADEVPEKTEGREGFYHVLEIKGTVEEASMSYIIRDHDRDKFEERKSYFKSIADKMNENFEQDVVHIELKDQYYNMGEIIKEDMRPIDLATAAMEELGIKAEVSPIRGGTDGSKISFMGLPTPNLFAGGENFHGKYEFVSVESMEKAKNVIAKIIEHTARQQ